MTARPGKIKQTVEVSLTRAERLDEDVKVSDSYVKTRHYLWTLLKEEVIRSQDCEKCLVETCTFGHRATAGGSNDHAN
jgi:NitT/TauT family transport system ATP-binding protein